MKKYLNIFRLAFRRVWVYKGVSLVYLGLVLLNYGLNLAIWSVAYRSPLKQPAASFTVFINYYAILLLVSQLVLSFTAGVIAEEHIKRGELSMYLLKPFPYFLRMLILEIPWRIVAFLFSLPFIGIVFYAFSSRIHIELPVLATAVLIIIFAYFLSFLTQFAFALLTFWFEDTHGLLSFIEILSILFTGTAIPIFFFPPILKTLSAWLPFQYTGYFPIMFIAGQLSVGESWFNFMILLLWITLLVFTAKFLWIKGLRKFSGEGI